MRLLAPTLVVALVVTASAAGSVSRGSANVETFRDAVGEDAAGPDITTVRVSNDDAGAIRFRIAIPNRPVLQDDMRLRILIDADANAATGLLDGTDYYLLYDPLLQGHRDFRLMSCETTDGVGTCGSSGVNRPTIPFSYSGGVSVTIDRSDLGSTNRFRFLTSILDDVAWVPGVGWDFGNAHFDPAPDTDAWSYEVILGPSRLLVQRFSTTPAKPVAGKTFVAKLKARRDDNGAFVTTGKVACSATVGRARLRVQRSGFAQGAAFCAWRVPEGSSGKSLLGSIGVTLSGKTAKKAFALKVS